jgi:hypothetical protein
MGSVMALIVIVIATMSHFSNVDAQSVANGWDWYLPSSVTNSSNSGKERNHLSVHRYTILIGYGMV